MQQPKAKGVPDKSASSDDMFAEELFQLDSRLVRDGDCFLIKLVCGFFPLVRANNKVLICVSCSISNLSALSAGKLSMEEPRMVMKLLKTEDKDELLVQRVMYTKRYSLILNKKRCVGCDICKTVCPREAIEIRGRNETGGEELGQPTITIDENKCSFCGICNAICPFGAFTLAMNGERVIPVLEKESFPRLVREIEIDESRCPVD